jgi:hypothetical protein
MKGNLAQFGKKVKKNEQKSDRKNKRDRRSAYDVTLRRVRINFVAVENRYVLRFRYAAWKAHELYYIVVRGMLGCTTFFHIISYTARLSG